MANCKECKEQRANQEKNIAMIPYFVHECAIARADRTNKRLWIALIASVAALFASNIVCTILYLY